METHKARHTSQPDSCLFLCTSEGRRGTYFHTCETLGSFLALQNTERLRIKGYYYYFAWLECRAGESVIRDGPGLWCHHHQPGVVGRQGLHKAPVLKFLPVFLPRWVGGDSRICRVHVPVPCGSLVNKLFKELKRGEINEAAIDPTSAAD